MRVLEPIGLRGIVIAASSLPEKYQRTLGGPPIRVQRVELLIWQALQSREQASLIAFGDYGITFPHETDPPGPVIVPSRVRISTNTEHLLFKGRRGQYRSLSEHVLSHEEVAKLAPSWGLNCLRGCGAGSEGEGNATSWVARDANAHIESTAMFLDSVLSKLGRAASDDEAPSQRWPWLQNFLFDKQ